MRFPALILITVFLFPSVAFAESATNELKVHIDGNSTVIIESQTQASSSSTTSTTSKTDINVQHSGEGTSQVTVNGKEYIWEGEGDWSVHEEYSESTSSGSTPVDEETDSDSSSSASSDEPSSVKEKIKEKLEELLQLIENIFN
ncbi:MAG TPA: hypothetical protein VJ179_01445 [Patescibacteria group bacterium]|nr:hypothetical protein [Patescibacteria group bacterium]